jgi:hypothetical protein
MSRRVGSASNDPIAAETAEERLAGGASAQEAVLSAYFACAGADPGVLLGPSTLITSGSTAAARCFDGRSRQPGAGAKRPRGHEDADKIPDAARVGVPMGPQSLLVASGYVPSGSTATLLRAGIQRAKASGSAPREALLRRVAEVGARAFTEPAFVRALFHDADASHGGHLTRGDLSQVPTLDSAATESSHSGVSLLQASWQTPSEAASNSALGRAVAVVALDSSGGSAALVFYVATEGIRFAELDLVAPLQAVPVRRGVPRLAPGSPLPAPAAVALVADQGRVIGAVASPDMVTVPDRLDDAPLRVFRQDRYGQVGTSLRRWG